MADKPSLETVYREVAEGSAHEIIMEVPAIIRADGTPVYPGDDGKVYLDHARVRLSKGVPVIGEGRPKGFAALLTKVRRGAAGVLELLNSPIMAALLPASTLARVLQIASVASSSREVQLAAVIKAVGNQRLAEVWDEIEAARSASSPGGQRITEEEYAAIIRRAKGGKA